jgi:hypothetical protein
MMILNDYRKKLYGSRLSLHDSRCSYEYRMLKGELYFCMNDSQVNLFYSMLSLYDPRANLFDSR